MDTLNRLNNRLRRLISSEDEIVEDYTPNGMAIANQEEITELEDRIDSVKAEISRLKLRVEEYEIMLNSRRAMQMILNPHLKTVPIRQLSISDFSGDRSDL